MALIQISGCSFIQETAEFLFRILNEFATKIFSFVDMIKNLGKTKGYGLKSVNISFDPPTFDSFNVLGFSVPIPKLSLPRVEVDFEISSRNNDEEDTQVKKQFLQESDPSTENLIQSTDSSLLESNSHNQKKLPKNNNTAFNPIIDIDQESQIDDKTMDNLFNSAFLSRNEHDQLRYYNIYLELHQRYENIHGKRHRNYISALNNSGIACYSLGQFKNAIKLFDRTIELNPSDENPIIRKGDVLYRLKKYKEALECYDKAISISEQSSAIYFIKPYGPWLGRGNVLYELESYQEALECYDKSIELYAKNTDSWTGKIRALARLNRLDEIPTAAINLKEALLSS
jgi:Anaphase-promoting complex, cyclosome, subunit 3